MLDGIQNDDSLDVEVEDNAIKQRATLESWLEYQGPSPVKEGDYIEWHRDGLDEPLIGRVVVVLASQFIAHVGALGSDLFFMNSDRGITWNVTSKPSEKESESPKGWSHTGDIEEVGTNEGQDKVSEEGEVPCTTD